MISHISTTLLVTDEKEDTKYNLVEDILSASNYYEALGLPDDSSFDEIRRAYIQKSRICHPDKFVPPYPRATKSFQGESGYNAAQYMSTIPEANATMNY
ncbi:hypothetical protein MBANPS3_005067 [Mucor bainieri]